VTNAAPILTTTTTTTISSSTTKSLHRWWIPAGPMTAGWEVMGASVVAFVCMLYYAWTHVFETRPTPRSAAHTPLVTSCARFPSPDLLPRVYKAIQSALQQHNLSLARFSQEQDAWVQIIRESLALRQSIHTFLQIVSQDKSSAHGHYTELAAALTYIHPRLLPVPTLPNLETFAYRIAVIVPLYKESPERLERILQYAHDRCTHPQCVQIILAHAVDSDTSSASEYTPLVEHLQRSWGHVQLVPVPPRAGMGRGPTQNVGAAQAQAAILTFLHADVLVPHQWDVRILSVWYPSLETTSIDCNGSTTTITLVSNKVHQACAFAFDVDVSPEGLQGLPYPWGLRVITYMVNVRSYWFRLPYGDQFLSIPSTYWHYWGGFPHEQPMMEDYELMDVLRQRARDPHLKEGLVMLPPPGAQCSPRRWQQHGVVRVTLTNALIVRQYRKGIWTPQDIFELYYGKSTDTKSTKNATTSTISSKED
jgi:hypothetical protein